MISTVEVTLRIYFSDFSDLILPHIPSHTHLHRDFYCGSYFENLLQKNYENGRKHLTIHFRNAIMSLAFGITKANALHLGVAQLVARYLGVVEAASSSLVTQTR